MLSDKMSKCLSMPSQKQLAENSGELVQPSTTFPMSFKSEKVGLHVLRDAKNKCGNLLLISIDISDLITGYFSNIHWDLNLLSGDKITILMHIFHLFSKSVFHLAHALCPG